MFSKSKWISSGLWKPKNPHSLENLKYLYTMLNKNQVVTENNKGMIVETLRSMSEILIWGDQNDSSVFDFFLEKNMLVFFLKFMRQKSGRYICVQLLQTLNILFDNISDETSVYFLLSNNHINSIIVHKFDFSDEEVIAYYISFLKTLSLKLNKHTIHFFYNENTNDFALYTEAIKFFNHSESMVRIAVRTITLNVYKVDDRSMLRYIRDKTAAPYFSNLVWFIGNHILELDSCVRNDADHNSRDRLADLVAEHLDHLHYLNDILCLGIDALNDVLTDHLLNRLLLPLYIYSLTKRKKYTEHLEGERPHIHSVVSLFLLSQVFLILSHKPMVRVLMDIIFNSEYDIFAVEGNNKDSTEKMLNITCSVPGFVKPAEPLADTLESNSGKKKRNKKRSVAKQQTSTSTLQQQPSAATPDKQKQTTQPKTLSVAEATNSTPASSDAISASPNATVSDAGADSVVNVDASVTEHNTSTAVQAESPEKKATKKEEAHSDDVETEKSLQYPSQSQESEYYTSTNVTDEEKLNAAAATTVSSNSSSSSSSDSKPSASSSSLACEDGSQFSLDNRPYFEAIFMALECSENDYEALFALCLLYAMGHNEGVNQELMDAAFMPTDKSATKHHYNTALIEKLIAIIRHSCENGSKVRLATLEMSVLLLKQLVYKAPAAPTVGVGVGGSTGSGPSTPTRAQNQGEGAAGVSYLQDQHLAAIEAAHEEAALLLRNFYKVWEKSEEIFLDMFQDEYNEMKTRPLNVECLMMDASILLPPTGTPLTGIQFNKRLPCGEVERARRAIRVFFHIRELSLTLRNEPETQLPLTKQEECVSVDDVLDLNNSDLIGCTVITKDGQKDRRFLVIDVLQLILVKPDSRRLGWGVVKFVGFLQDVEVTGDKDDSRSLHVTIHKPTMNSHARPQPLLCAKFVLDDHIRCMAAKQRLTKGRLKARQRKMQMIARLLQLQDYYPSSHSQQAAAHSTAHGAASAAANAAAAVAAAAASTGSAVPGGSAVLNKPSPTTGIGGGTGVTMRGGTPGATASTTVIQNQAAPMRGIPGRSHPLKPMRAEVSRNLRIDQNAADQSSDSLVLSRVRTASQAAKASTASSSRVSQPQNRNIQQLAQKQIPQQSNNANSNVNSTNAANVGNKASTDGSVQTKAVGDTDDQSVPATPEAHAVMSLNQPLIAAQSTNNGTANVHRSGSSSSRTSSLDRSSSPVQEIPLEDLSVSRHNHITSRSRSRSSSYSPGRFRRLSAGHKQNSTTGNGGEQERNSRPQARSNSKSDQSDVPSSPSSSHNAKHGDVVTSNNSSSSRSRSANIGLTSFTTDPHKDNDSSSLDEFASNDATLADNDDMDSDGKLSNHDNTSATPSSSSSATTSQGPQQQQEQRRRRTSSSSSSASAGMSQSSCPKSLIPPEEPVVSLIIDDSSSEQCDLSHVTPRLVPVGDATTSSPSSMHPHLSVLSSSVVIQPAASSNSDAISEADITAGSNR